MPPALLLVAGAVALLAPRAARPVVGVLAAGLTVLAAPAVAATPWPAVLVADLAVAAALLLGAAVRPRRGRVTVAVAASTAALLVGHALLVGCAAPAGAGAVLAVTAGLGVTVAALGRRGSGAQPVVAGVALAVALLAVPAGVVVALFGLGAPPWWQLRGGTAAVVLPVVAVARGPPPVARPERVRLGGARGGARRDRTRPAGRGRRGSRWGSTPWRGRCWRSPPVAGPGRRRRSGAAARVVGGSGGRGALAGLALLAAAPAALAVLGSLPVRPWSGPPTGTVAAGGGGPRRAGAAAPGRRRGGVHPVGGGVPAGRARGRCGGRSGADADAGDPGGGGDDARVGGGGADARVGADRTRVTGAAGSGRWLPVLAGLPFGAVALPVLLAAAGAPWPVVPAVAFGTGLGALLTVATVGSRPVLPAGGTRGRGGGSRGVTVGSRRVAVGAGSVAVGAGAVAVLLPLGAVLGGFGFGGLLATRAGTLVGLGTLVVAGVVVGVPADRPPSGSPAGWAPWSRPPASRSPRRWPPGCRCVPPGSRSWPSRP